jgi:hypothetical protein
MARPENSPSFQGVLLKWNGTRVCDPQQFGLPKERTNFQGF